MKAGRITKVVKLLRDQEELKNENINNGSSRFRKDNTC